MIETQILNKILEDRSLDFLLKNKLYINKFYKKKAELQYILNHFEKYGQVPDKETFINKFPDFEFIVVNESEEYLVENLLEEDTFQKALPILKEASNIMETDSVQAVKYLTKHLQDLEIKKSDSIDLINQAEIRYKDYLEMQVYKAKMVTFTGFKELDNVIEGFSNDELAVMFARLNNGKSWVVTKIATAAWEQGRRVGFYSGEMTADKVGYRIDAILGGFSNKALLKGYEVEGYKEYIEQMKDKPNPIQIITPEELDGYLTISKLETFIKEYNINFMVIDQLSLMVDETSSKNTQERTKFSNITKGLRRLSKKYQLPIIVAAQANRLGVKGQDDKGVPEMEHIAESDAIGQDATLAISMRIKDNQLEMQIKKYRDGVVGNKFVYALDLDHGKFEYLPTDENNKEEIKKAEQLKSAFNSGSDIFKW